MFLSRPLVSFGKVPYVISGALASVQCYIAEGSTEGLKQGMHDWTGPATLAQLSYKIFQVYSLRNKAAGEKSALGSIPRQVEQVELHYRRSEYVIRDFSSTLLPASPPFWSSAPVQRDHPTNQGTSTTASDATVNCILRLAPAASAAHCSALLCIALLTSIHLSYRTLSRFVWPDSRLPPPGTFPLPALTLT